MPLFEVETENHILITWAEDGDAASGVVGDAYPQEHVLRLTKRPRDTWVISKSALGISGKMLSGERLHIAVLRFLAGARRNRLLTGPQKVVFVAGRKTRINSNGEAARRNERSRVLREGIAQPANFESSPTTLGAHDDDSRFGAQGVEICVPFRS